MTRKECKEVLKSYKTYKVITLNRTIDLEEAIENKDQEKIRIYQGEIDRYNKILQSIESAVDTLDDEEYLVIDTYIKTYGLQYISLLTSDLRLTSGRIYQLLWSGIDKTIPFLEPIFN